MDSSSAAAPVTIYPRGILFDMDGVLVSSIGSVERTWKKWALARGIDPEAAIRMAHGRRAIETVRELRPDLNDVEELQWLEEMEVADKVGVSILDGVRPILESLPEKYWTVVTSATERIARTRMEQGGIRVAARIVSAEDVELGKPHPEPYRKGARILGLAPEECLVIEDSASGAQAGHAAGCTVLATLFSHSLESLSYADYIVRSLEDVQVRVSEETGAPLVVRFTPIARGLHEAVR
ncbi:MAG TPA: HAD-IA family hydrolase [Acidobacteriaceae bacterium]|jgi:sugar-phosphatase|nr:HAD-IA family hydrolase [Acidobacteriaceae bacterium]